MGWTGRQQLILLLQSGGLGLFLGVLYDGFAVLRGLFGRKPWQRFLWDALFGPTAGLVTFFVSLAMMDGRMRPLLFVGIGAGFVVQRLAVGRPLARLFLHKWRGWRTDRQKNRPKSEKTAKNRDFFEKNT